MKNIPNNEEFQKMLNYKAEKIGLNEILRMIINTIMHLERKAFLEEEKDPKNKGNGYRPVSMMGYGGLLILAIPRDRLGKFKPLLLYALKEHKHMIYKFSKAFYLRGVTTRKIKEIFEILYGKKYSQATISKMIQSFKEELENWRTRTLDSRYPVVYLDATFQKVRRGNKVSSEAFYIALAVKEDHTREIIGIYNFPTESASGWEKVLKELKKRGLQEINIVVADGLTGLENSVLAQYPRAAFQKCVAHFKRNMGKRVSKKEEAEMEADLKDLFVLEDNSYDKKKAYERAEKIRNKWGKKYPSMKKLLSKEHLRNYLTYLNFDTKIQSNIYTTNVLERLNGVFKDALHVRRVMPSVESTLLLISGVAINVEKKVYSKPIYNFADDGDLLEKLYNFDHEEEDFRHTF